MKFFFLFYFLLLTTLQAETTLFVEFGSTDYTKSYQKLLELSTEHAISEEWNYSFMYNKQSNWKELNISALDPLKVQVNPKPKDIMNGLVNEGDKLTSSADQIILFLHGHGTNDQEQEGLILESEDGKSRTSLQAQDIDEAFSQMPSGLKKKILATYCYDGAIHEVSFKRDDTCAISSTVPVRTSDFNNTYGFRFSEGAWSEVSSKDKQFDFDKNEQTSLWEAYASGVNLDGLNLNDSRTSSLAYIDKVLQLEQKDQIPLEEHQLEFLENMLKKHSEYFYYPKIKSMFCSTFTSSAYVTQSSQMQLLFGDVEKILNKMKKDEVRFPSEKIGYEQAEYLQKIWDQSFDRLQLWMENNRSKLDHLFSYLSEYKEIKARLDNELQDNIEKHQKYKQEYNEISLKMRKISDINSENYRILSEQRNFITKEANGLMSMMNKKREQQKEAEIKIRDFINEENSLESFSEALGSVNVLDQLKKMNVFCDTIQSDSPHLEKLRNLISCEMEPL